MNEETNMVTEQTPNRIEGSDLERKTGGADMETAGGDLSLSGGGMEQVRSDESPAMIAEDEAIRAHFDRLWQEAETFSREVPGFDLARELEDDAFAALLSPRRGLTLEQAYFVRRARLRRPAGQPPRPRPAGERRRDAGLPLGQGLRRQGERSPESKDPKGREDLPREVRRTDCHGPAALAMTRTI